MVKLFPCSCYLQAELSTSATTNDSFRVWFWSDDVWVRVGLRKIFGIELPSFKCNQKFWFILVDYGFRSRLFRIPVFLVVHSPTFAMDGLFVMRAYNENFHGSFTPYVLRHSWSSSQETNNTTKDYCQNRADLQQRVKRSEWFSSETLLLQEGH